MATWISSSVAIICNLVYWTNTLLTTTIVTVPRGMHENSIFLTRLFLNSNFNKTPELFHLLTQLILHSIHFVSIPFFLFHGILSLCTLFLIIMYCDPCISELWMTMSCLHRRSTFQFLSCETFHFSWSRWHFQWSWEAYLLMIVCQDYLATAIHFSHFCTIVMPDILSLNLITG